MNPAETSTKNSAARTLRPTKFEALADILIYIAAALVFYGIEEILRAADLFPFPAAFDGAFSLIASFFVVVILMKWRGQNWRDFGLRKPNCK